MLSMSESEVDEYLRLEILHVFSLDHRVRLDDLRVGVLNSIVHLAGKVDSLMMRNALEIMAKQVQGVRGVVNRIEAPGSPSPGRKINLNLKI